MIKTSSINKLIEQVVVRKLNDLLIDNNFKFLKSKQHYKRIEGEFIQIINIQSTHNPLNYNEENNEITLNFNLSSFIEAPKFDKWVYDKLKERSYFRHEIKIIEACSIIDFDLLNKSDFFSPTESQKFKNYVTTSLIGTDKNIRTSINNISKQITEIIYDFNRCSNFQTLYNERSNTYNGDYTRLLVYSNNLDYAKEGYKSTYNKYIEIIEEKINSDTEKTKRNIQGFEKLIKEVETLLQIIYKNPYAREIQKIPSKKQNIRLSPKLGYKEEYRFNTKLMDVKSFSVNDKGDSILLIEDKKLIKIDNKGNLTQIGKLEINEFYDDYNDFFVIKWIKDADCFICNNFLIKNNMLIELKIELDFNNYKKNKVSPIITEIVFDKKSKEFLIIFTPDYKQTIFLIYTINGELKETRKISQLCHKINYQRKEMIAKGSGNSFDILNYKGEVLKNYKFNNGNERIALSPDGNEMILHFYSTKSQYFRLDNNEKNALWAHPTYLKDYKEKYYSDIHHNFGMTYCQFTLDGKHIIGGADHGKYVAWDTNKFERKEMIPNDASLDIFNQYSTSIINGESKISFFKPYVSELENQKIFINRGYSISNISFINQGEYIITQVGDSLLVWDDCLNNIGHVYGLEKIMFSDTNYLISNTKEELVIFKRVNQFNEDFISSVFKEKEPINSNITNLNIKNTKIEDNGVGKLEKVITQQHKNENIKGGKSFFARLFKKKST